MYPPYWVSSKEGTFQFSFILVWSPYILENLMSFFNIHLSMTPQISVKNLDNIWLFMYNTNKVKIISI